MPKVDLNAVAKFAGNWIGAGVFGAIGWALSVTYVIPHLPLP